MGMNVSTGFYLSRGNFSFSYMVSVAVYIPMTYMIRMTPLHVLCYAKNIWIILATLHVLPISKLTIVARQFQ